jgi:hypothetical protein
MRRHARIVLRSSAFVVQSPATHDVRPAGAPIGATLFLFPTLGTARAFCECCEFTWSVFVPALHLNPPPGRP